MSINEGFRNAEELAKNSELFNQPSKEDLDNLKIGDHVQVSHSSERFWVKIRGIRGSELLGSVDNDLERAPFSWMEEIKIERKNVYAIINN